MAVFKKFQEFIGKRFLSPKEIDPEPAYDLWSQQYDNQPGNLMLALDEEIFFDLVNNISLNDKIILDVGCGTGTLAAAYRAMNPKARLFGIESHNRKSSRSWQASLSSSNGVRP